MWYENPVSIENQKIILQKYVDVWEDNRKIVEDAVQDKKNNILRAEEVFTKANPLPKPITVTEDKYVQARTMDLPEERKNLKAEPKVPEKPVEPKKPEIKPYEQWKKDNIFGVGKGLKVFGLVLLFCFLLRLISVNHWHPFISVAIALGISILYTVMKKTSLTRTDYKKSNQAAQEKYDKDREQYEVLMKNYHEALKAAYKVKEENAQISEHNKAVEQKIENFHKEYKDLKVQVQSAQNDWQKKKDEYMKAVMPKINEVYKHRLEAEADEIHENKETIRTIEEDMKDNLWIIPRDWNLIRINTDPVEYTHRIVLMKNIIANVSDMDRTLQDTVHRMVER